MYINQSTGPGNITFQSRIDYPLTADISGIVIADLNADYKPDISICSGTTITIYPNNNVATDVTPPNAVCKNITLPLDVNGNATLTASMVDGGSNDACGSVNLSISSGLTSYNCTNLGPNVVTLLVTDMVGLTATCQATVTVTPGPSVILKQPANIYLCGGTTADAYVLANNTGYTYQWQVNTGSSWGDLSDNADYSGSTTNHLLISNITSGFNGYKYRVVISGASLGCTGQEISGESLMTVSTPTSTVAGTSTPLNLLNPATPTIVDPDITVTYGSTIVNANVGISQNFSSGDVLAVSGLPGGVTSSYNSSTGVLSITGSMSASTLQGIFRNVTYATTSGSSLTRTVTFSLGDKSPWSNGHFYEYKSGTVTWPAARTAAATFTYFGRTGYLATITSEAENSFIKSKFSNTAWFGLSDDYLMVNDALGSVVYSSQSATEGRFFIITGPEMGQLVSVGNATPVAQPGMYMNWSGGEPNNGTGNEHYAWIYGNSGDWNDIDATTTSGYVVEYGGLSGEPCISYSFGRQVLSCSNPTAGGTIAAAQSGCNPFTPSPLTNSVSPSGHNGTLEYKWQSSTTGAGSGFSDISGTNAEGYAPGALTQDTWFKRLARVTCKSDWTGAAESNVVKITVEPVPSAGTLAKTPNEANICEGTDVSAILTAGSGGNGTDETQYSTHDGNSWSTWATYVSGTSISTTGKTQVEIRTRRLASVCSSSTYTSASWIVETTPVTGTLAKSPNVTNVCEGTEVWASLTTGSGGNGNDVLEFRTLNGSWSDWNTYYSDEIIYTEGLAGVEIRTYREADYCNNASAVTVSWIVDPTTVEGVVTGGAVVCYGAHSTLLTLSGHTGSVVKWQFSTDGTNWNDIANTATTYTAENLTVNTWYRAVVKSGTCQEEFSAATQITMFTDYHVSGYAKYYNNPKTPLDGLKITLKQGGTVIGTPVVTGATGYYDFGGLVNGNYDIEITSAHTSGQWQTWNGCNNTDYLLVSRHATGVALLASEPPVVRVSGDVIAPSALQIINTLDANAVRNAARYGWFKPGVTPPSPWFDIPKWVFSGTSSAAPISNFGLQCANVTRNIYGLCAGDVNGSYIPPSGLKMAEPSLQLVNRGEIGLSREMTFPVKAESAMEIGAITLMLNFDPQKIVVTGVEMVNNTGEEPYFLVNGNQLHIGWMSMEPLKVTEGQPVLYIKVRMADKEGAMSYNDERIRFTLDRNPISELADGFGNVIGGAKLSLADARKGIVSAEGTLSVFPNPAGSMVNIEYMAAEEGVCTIELCNLHGGIVKQISRETLPAGMHQFTTTLDGVPNGVYMIILKTSDRVLSQKLVVTR